MKLNRRLTISLTMLLSLIASLTLLSTQLRADTQTTGTCGGLSITIPFTDVPNTNIFFCSIAGSFFSGLTNGTSPTTYGPTQPVPREQMAAFVTRTLDQSLTRGSKRAALGQWWTYRDARTIIPLGVASRYVASDGVDLWVSNSSSNDISRVNASKGQDLGSYHSVPSPQDIVIVSNNVFIASSQSPGKIYRVFGYQVTSGPAFEEAAGLGSNPVGITYDGANLWTANSGTGPGTGSVSRVAPGGVVTTYTTAFSQPVGILFDGSNLWVTDRGDNSLKRVDLNNGSVPESINLGPNADPRKPVFDGTNLWVPCYGTNEVAVVRAVGGLRGTVLARLTGNGLSGPNQAAFDGERIMVTNYLSGTNNSASLWKATDLTPIGANSIIPPGIGSFFPTGVCSDGHDFWVTLSGQTNAAGEGALARF